MAVLFLFVKKILKFLLPHGFVVLLPLIRRYIETSKPKKTLEFEIHLADNCNLNCKGCGHFSPLVNNRNYLDTNIFKRDMSRLGELCDKKISRISLMGGEPLHNPNISEICTIAREYSTGMIEIITNGLLLDSQPNNFWEVCKKSKINITVSSYPVKINREEINKIAQSYGVNIVYRGGDKTRPWSKFVLDIDGKQNYKKSFYSCPFSNSCIFLKNGNIATCGLPFYIEHFNNYFDKNLIVQKNDYINIYEVKNVDEILKFCSKPIKFCRYCNINESDFYKVEWGISKRAIEEWT